MVSPIFFVSMVVMILVMGAVTVLAVISSLKNQTPLSRWMRNLSGGILSYMILCALQFFSLEYQNSPYLDKALGCLADMSYFAVLICWVRIIMEVSQNKTIFTHKTMCVVTIVYGILAETIVFFAAAYTQTGEFFIASPVWRISLVAANAAYVLWLMIVSLRYLHFACTAMKPGTAANTTRLLSGILLAYLVWTLVIDYRLVTSGTKMSEIVLIDPLIIAYAALGGWIIYFFFKKDPLHLFIKDEERKREEKIQAFIEEHRLTKREREVLDLVCSGMNNPAIAETLCISENTVKRHLNNIFQKTGAVNRYELISLVLDK